MPEMQLPTVAVYPLPAEALRAPMPASAQANDLRDIPSTDMNALCEALTPMISAAIAKQTRQRRYTP